MIIFCRQINEMLNDSKANVVESLDFIYGKLQTDDTDLADNADCFFLAFSFS